MHKWALESLVGQLLTTKKCEIREGRNTRTVCNQFKTGAVALNYLGEIENAEYGIYRKNIDIFLEMHRIAQRQFPWQRSHFGVARFYRYVLIYGQGDCNDYFTHKFGISINEFSLIGFAIYMAFQESSCLTRSYSLEKLGVKPAAFEAALKLLSVPIQQARASAASLSDKEGNGIPTAFQPSFLRRIPVVSFGSENERIRAALPELIPLRITSGLYYDLVPGGQKLLNEANDQFENYTKGYIDAMMPRFDVSRSYQYGPKGTRKASPDIIIRDRGQISIVVECKATKLTLPAQYTEDPTVTAKNAYDQIAKGVFQLWRYFSHIRRGIDDSASISPNVHGIVLTLDMWLLMAQSLKQKVLTSANKLADKDSNISAEDRRTIVFCTIEDLELVLSYSDEDLFLHTLAVASEDRFVGWALPEIYRSVASENQTQKPFPFPLGGLLPWWDKLPA